MLSALQGNEHEVFSAITVIHPEHGAVTDYLSTRVQMRPLSELEIESLDLAVIVFDIEDTFGIEIPYNANEEVEAFATVGSVVDRVKGIIAESKASGAAA